MPLFGTFDTMQLTDVIQWVLQSKASGRLVITVDMEETSLQFREGDLCALSGDSLRLDLGHYLLRHGKITDEQLQQLMQRKSAVGSLKARIVASEILEYGALVKYEREYAIEILMDLFFCMEGSFHFTPGGGDNVLDEKQELIRLEKPISTRNALMDVMRRMDEWNRIIEVFPSSFTVVRATGERDDFIHRSMLEIGSPIAIADLCVRLELGRFTVYQRLYQLYEDGNITVDRMCPEKADHEALGPVRELIENASVLLSERQYEEARELLATILNLEPENKRAKELSRTLREEQLKYLYEQIPPHKTPELIISRERLQQMPLSHKEIFLGGRLNGRWDVGMLVMATSLGELDTLRVLRKLIHAGIVQLT
ncbi:MAG: DUF4388 domain-containing protein [Deltaproteobacteria bacterium]|nr:DUF4388 domain-containing protein [Deltaproteobacteria bacterium]MBN2673180.1 DUF4388 domain-containing protein [Deltaproteobacteria bacterium]